MKSKLLLALKCTLNNTWLKNRQLCAHCPFGYNYQTSDDTWSCDDLKIFDDVYSYLQKNTQHMLSKKEVQERALNNAPLWFESLGGSNVHNGWKLAQTYPPFVNDIYLCDFNQRGVFYSLRQYGKTWRAWAQSLDKETYAGETGTNRSDGEDETYE